MSSTTHNFASRGSSSVGEINGKVQGDRRPRERQNFYGWSSHGHQMGGKGNYKRRKTEHEIRGEVRRAMNPPTFEQNRSNHWKQSHAMQCESDRRYTAASRRREHNQRRRLEEPRSRDSQRSHSSPNSDSSHHHHEYRRYGRSQSNNSKPGNGIQDDLSSAQGMHERPTNSRTQTTTPRPISQGRSNVRLHQLTVKESNQSLRKAQSSAVVNGTLRESGPLVTSTAKEVTPEIQSNEFPSVLDLSGDQSTFKSLNGRWVPPKKSEQVDSNRQERKKQVPSHEDSSASDRKALATGDTEPSSVEDPLAVPARALTEAEEIATPLSQSLLGHVTITSLAVVSESPHSALGCEDSLENHCEVRDAIVVGDKGYISLEKGYSSGSVDKILESDTTPENSVVEMSNQAGNGDDSRCGADVERKGKEDVVVQHKVAIGTKPENGETTQVLASVERAKTLMDCERRIVASQDSFSDSDSSSGDESDTDDEELAHWAHTMLGALSPTKQKHQLLNYNRLVLWNESSEKKRVESESESASDTESDFESPIDCESDSSVEESDHHHVDEESQFYGYPRQHLKRKKKRRKMRVSTEELLKDAKRKKEEARAPTAAELKAIFDKEDATVAPSTSWVRRSVRQPSKSYLHSGTVRSLIEKLKANDGDMVVLKMKKYVNDPDTPPVVIEAALDALEENTNCQALYIQNFNQGMRDKQILRLLRVLQLPTCKIWCLNVGETYNVKMSTWRKFARGLKRTSITHMYASEHTITPELKDQIRETIRNNRKKHSMHIDPDNLDVIVQCTHCWWNPMNAKVLRPYLQKRGFGHVLMDKEKQGLKGSMSTAPGISPKPH